MSRRNLSLCAFTLFLCGCTASQAPLTSNTTGGTTTTGTGGTTTTGGGTTGGTTTGGTTGGIEGITLAGVAARGPMSSGTVTVASVNSDGSSGSSLASGTVQADGSFTLTVPPTTSGPLRVTVQGGSYVSELDGSTQTTSTSITAIVDSPASFPTLLPVTPLTTLVDSYTSGLFANGTTFVEAHQTADAAVMATYGFTSGTSAESVIPSFSASTSGSQALLLGVLGGLESESASLGLTDRGSLVTALAQDISDGTFNGLAGTGAVSLNGGVLPATAGTSLFLSGVNSYSAAQASAIPALPIAATTITHAVVLATTNPAVAGTVTSYALPGQENPFGIAPGPDGNVYVSDSESGQISRVTPTGTATAVANVSTGFGFTLGPDGNLWSTVYGGGVVRITPLGNTTTFTTGISGSALGGICAGPDGNLWFTEQNPPSGGTQSLIGRITPSGTVTEFALPSQSNPWGITAGPDGNVWFTEFASNAVGKITPTGAITQFPVSLAGLAEGGIVTGPDTNLWLSDGQNTIGFITTLGNVTSFNTGSNVSTLANLNTITAGADGNLWFTEYNNTAIGRITPAGNVTQFTSGIPAGTLNDITAGPDGNIWFTGSFGVGRITP